MTNDVTEAKGFNEMTCVRVDALTAYTLLEHIGLISTPTIPLRVAEAAHSPNCFSTFRH